jgi:hypothetical protein
MTTPDPRRHLGMAWRRRVTITMSRLQMNRENMTIGQALQWAEKNCTPETIERLRSRAVVAALAAEVHRLREAKSLLQEASGKMSHGKWSSDFRARVNKATK